ncbi:TadE/TadG family type IV pilus assembly protein [Streptomyces sp. NPDC058603]|uniref:TadE/TadG family type IV pilus assembly protein n=1 Tax=Streptomyces sp. NPDC058603 TaxID=3346551 RepID=UPI003649B5A7
MSVPRADVRRYGEGPAARPGDGGSRAERLSDGDRSRGDRSRGDRSRGDRLRGGRSRDAWLRSVRLRGARLCDARLRDTRLRDDRGQLAVEFVGMVPIILGTVILLWQAALVGYTFSLAGNAADEAVRAGTVAETETLAAACERAGTENLPGAWSATIRCSDDSETGLVEAEVDLEVPVLFPGFNIPVTVPGQASAVRES